jgi:hypothetical protein
VDGARVLDVGRLLDAFFVAGRAERDGRDGDFDMLFSLVDRGGDMAHTLGGSKRRPQAAVSGTDEGAHHAPRGDDRARARRGSS